MNLDSFPGYRWEGASELTAYRGPRAAACTPGWRMLFEREDGDFSSRLVFWGLAALLVTLFPHGVAEILLASQGFFWLSVLLERWAGRRPGKKLHAFRWDDSTFTLQACGTAERSVYRVGDVAHVAWEPLRWYGYFSRRPLVLGAQVSIRLTNGESLLVARGFDTRRLRALGERLSNDWRVDMVECLERPLVRRSDQLDESLNAKPSPRRWLRVPTYCDWKLTQRPGRIELAIGDGKWHREALNQVLDQSGSWLVTILCFDLLRFPAVMWINLLNVAGLNLPSAGLFWMDRWDVLLHGLACLPLVWNVYRSRLPRRFVLANGLLRYEEGGRSLAQLPLAALEQVRAEDFPRPALRLVTDAEEVLIDELPSRVDFEALAEYLPRLVGEAAFSGTQASRTLD